MCSKAVVTTPSPRPASWAARAAPFTARLSASVPPPVRTISDGSAPSATAICSRASSSAVLAARAAACAPDAFPNISDWYGRMAAAASGYIGVVAA